MQAIGLVDTTENLRTCLRGATANAHDLLDSTMRSASGWETLDDYAQFLTLQHAARAPVEAWLAEHAPADLLPPAQCEAIERDLEALGRPVLQHDVPFAPKLGENTEGYTLGAAWVLAGSSLGNRAILKEVTRAGYGDWPTAFLGDDAMLTYWQGLRRRIERPADIAEIEAASSAATAVFDHFLRFAQDTKESDEAVTKEMDG